MTNQYEHTFPAELDFSSTRRANSAGTELTNRMDSNPPSTDGGQTAGWGLPADPNPPSRGWGRTAGKSIDIRHPHP